MLEKGDRVFAHDAPATLVAEGAGGHEWLVRDEDGHERWAPTEQIVQREEVERLRDKLAKVREWGREHPMGPRMKEQLDAILGEP